MIPRDYITAWRQRAPWTLDGQIEQDLVLSRALVEIYSDPLLARELAFRGGTALHKLFFDSPGRYSEDIDLVQITAGAAGPVMTALRARLDPWLGKPGYKQGRGRITFKYSFDSEVEPVTPMRLKVEINTREHFNVLGHETRRFTVDNPWFSGEADVLTHPIEELLGTKLRALYQRKKGRDVYDLAFALERVPQIDAEKIVECFTRYLEYGGTQVSRAQLEVNLAAKRSDPVFVRDIVPLLSSEALGAFDADAALDRVLNELVCLLPGEPWKGDAEG